MLDAEGDDLPEVVADAVQDAVGTSAGGPDTGEVLAQWFPDAVRAAGRVLPSGTRRWGDDLRESVGQGAAGGRCQDDLVSWPEITDGTGAQPRPRGPRHPGSRPGRPRGCLPARPACSGRRWSPPAGPGPEADQYRGDAAVARNDDPLVIPHAINQFGEMISDSAQRFSAHGHCCGAAPGARPPRTSDELHLAAVGSHRGERSRAEAHRQPIHQLPGQHL